MRTACLSAIVMLAAAFPAAAQDKAKSNTLTPKEIADGWILLFDGETTFGWQRFHGDVQAKSGELVLHGTADAKTRLASGQFGLGWDYQWIGGPRATAWIDTSGSGRAGSQLARRPRDGAWWSAYYSGYFTETGPTGGTGVFGGDEELYCVRFLGYRYQFPETVIYTCYDYGDPRGIHFDLEMNKGSALSLRNIRLKPLGLKPLFNGKDLTGWHVFPGKKSTFTVEDGAIVCKNGPGDLQTEGKYANFILQLECKSNGKHLNSGVFFRCKANEYQNGYEAQIHNDFTADPPKTYTVEEYDPQTHKLLKKDKVTSAAKDYGTGAIYRRVPARKSVAKDGEWFTMTIVAEGNHIATWVNGIQQVDWYDNRPPSDNPRSGCRLEAGHISFQGHDSTTNLSFRNIRIAELPGAPTR